jgi:hypothetical protein
MIFAARRFSLSALVAVMGCTMLLLVGCNQTPTAGANDPIREELAKLQQEMTALAASREEITLKMAALQNELTELDQVLRDREEVESVLQDKLYQLAGIEAPRQRSSSPLSFWMQLFFVFFTLVIIFIIFKIRRSQQRDAQRLDHFRRILGEKSQTNLKAVDSEKQPDE